ncbi:MAG: DNA polymerase III subunit epsilon [Sulfurovum sp. AS07-7]|nr:MAG: DNA polymerase III subunit epsilon [Sulfurovum sp. AS07-7]
MQKICNELTQSFRKHHGLLSVEKYRKILRRFPQMYDEEETIFFLLQAMGYPIDFHQDNYTLKSYFTPLKRQKFCVIDIETNGSKPENSQIIEVGAVMIEDGKIIDKFSTFVRCNMIPEYITKVTGIQHKDLRKAPTKLQVLSKLREFMSDSIFVAHNANFDYSFLDSSFAQVGLGGMCNQKLCTIDLAHRTFEAERYGLAYLNDFLEINTPILHRAYNDALTTSKVLAHEFDNLPMEINSTDELLRFSIAPKKEPREVKNK